MYKDRALQHYTDALSRGHVLRGRVALAAHFRSGHSIWNRIDAFNAAREMAGPDERIQSRLLKEARRLDRDSVGHAKRSIRNSVLETAAGMGSWGLSVLALKKVLPLEFAALILPGSYTITMGISSVVENVERFRFARRRAPLRAATTYELWHKNWQDRVGGELKD